MFSLSLSREEVQAQLTAFFAFGFAGIFIVVAGLIAGGAAFGIARYLAGYGRGPRAALRQALGKEQ